METPAHRPKLVPVAVVIFGIGLLALAAIFVLYVSGRHDLPLWLNTSAGIGVPLGFGLALIGLVREARRDTRLAKRANRAAQLPSVAADSASQSANPVKSDSTSSAPAARS